MNLVGRLAVLGAAGIGATVLAERWVGNEIASGDGPDPVMKMVIAIDAPIDDVWRVVADLERQPTWMSEMKAVRVYTPGPTRVGTRGEADVRIFLVGMVDTVEVDVFEPPCRFGIRHVGVYAGEGRIVLEALDAGRTLVRWDERMVPPAFPNLGQLLQKPILGAIFQGDLERLKELVESGHVEAVAGAGTDAGCAARALARLVELHLVDATYELFRAYHAPRPPVLGRDGVDYGAVAGLVGTLLGLLRFEGATHVGCAHDRVIRSFRNDLYAGYKTEAGAPADLLAQFPLAEEAISALGLVLWAETEFEADDALATAAARWGAGAHPSVTRVVVCTPDKDLAQVVVDDRVVLRDRRRDITYDEAAVRAKWGVPPASIADYLALVGDAADGYPGLPGFGSKGAAAVLSAFGSLEGVRDAPLGMWPTSVRGAARLAATLREQWDAALLYRDLATLRRTVPLPQHDPAELAWRGANRDAWSAFCDRLGLASLAARPHRWQSA